MKKEGSIAVVIPLYNKAPHIARTLESVFEQTILPNEVIVVDDGSTDGGAEATIPYIEKYGVRLIRQPNMGVSVARNRGVDEANSDYIAFLDADDIWLPDHIRVIKGLIRSYPQAALFSTAHLLERSGVKFRPRSLYPEGWQGIVTDFFSAYAHGLGLINSITACAKKKAILDVGGFPIQVRRGEDIVCWINMGLKYPVAHAEVVTAVYCQDTVNRSTHLRETEPPTSLQHIAALLRTRKLTKIERKGLLKLFDRIALFSAAGFKAEGDIDGAKAICRLAFNMSRYRVATLTALLSWIPGKLLLVAKKFRHPRVKDNVRPGRISHP